MLKTKKEMLSALSSGIDLTKPTFGYLSNYRSIDTLEEIRNVKAVIVNLINVLLEED